MSSADPQHVQALPAAPAMAPPAALPPSFATLAAELRLHAGDRAQDFGPIAAIQALILALLVRLLGRLDGMFQRWQQGQLPLPTPARPRTMPAPRPRDPSASARIPFTWADPSPAQSARHQFARAEEQSTTEGTEKDTESTEVEFPLRVLRAPLRARRVESLPYACPSRLNFQNRLKPSPPSRAHFITI
jgi:hypothetical protein